MTDPHMRLDSHTGSNDLAWLLVLLFFVTTFVGVRKSALVGEVAADASGLSDPVILGFESERLVLKDRGTASPPAVGEAVTAWLSRTCATEAVPTVIRCPGEATHQWCQEQLRDLLRDAPGCGYRY